MLILEKFNIMKASFFSDLKSLDLKDEHQIYDFCRKKVLHGTPYIFKNQEDHYYSFRKKIAQKYEISFHEIYITGSAKLGFSPHKNKDFDLDSDIDVAIISEKLFEKVMLQITEFQMALRSSRKSLQKHELDTYHSFLEYTAMGWIRPDKLPIKFQMKELKNDWFDFFHSLSYGKSEVGNYKVAAGIFKSYSHYERYIVSGFTEVKHQIGLTK
jgi:hypothetical protein